MTDEPSRPVSIRLRPNGPYMVEGPVRIIDHQGREFTCTSDKKGVALCRCGHSARRPFCDGSHRQHGFTAEETAPGDEGSPT